MLPRDRLPSVGANGLTIRLNESATVPCRAHLPEDDEAIRPHRPYDCFRGDRASSSKVPPRSLVTATDGSTETCADRGLASQQKRS
jgi:hypothetical protein